jgi:hypothetical protein
MKFAIALNKNIECEYICQQIQKLVTKFQQDGGNLPQSILVIDIIQTVDGGDNHIPKIEYHPDSLT